MENWTLLVQLKGKTQFECKLGAGDPVPRIGETVRPNELTSEQMVRAITKNESIYTFHVVKDVQYNFACKEIFVHL